MFAVRRTWQDSNAIETVNQDVSQEIMDQARTCESLGYQRACCTSVTMLKECSHHGNINMLRCQSCNRLPFVFVAKLKGPADIEA